MSEPITKEDRVDAMKNVDSMEHCPEHMRDVICGYEALVVHMENRFEQHAAMAIRKQHNLERLLKIADEALLEIAFWVPTICYEHAEIRYVISEEVFTLKRIAADAREALAAMAKEKK
jgi:hypothetical protein